MFPRKNKTPRHDERLNRVKEERGERLQSSLRPWRSSGGQVWGNKEAVGRELFWF